ncbi:DEAD/DEAH box helicase [Rudanella paleaurantiibacter]|uniref:DEAD/DEAH box helicase n=1 Tax=Rudanella paleaurantiibacter TaxID=2614655 RepID=A0A7J5TZY8_9BACT|nr:DEAD/DEAH box helicase [Rudanella paleaurantiibacter]KAB7730977.1 DEAD/DEAH box helicase [Rudanella paleaurantiibacter]
MKFSDYNIAPEVKQNLETLGFKRPTDIQYKAIPPILKGEDVLAIAQTGTGKTAAFAIPIISQLHVRKTSSRSEGIRCVVMVPTRELAIQIAEAFTELARHTKVRIYAVTGGVDQDPQIARLEKGFDILVATPGRVFDLVHQGHLRLNRVEMLVLDEADHMLDLGFIKDIRDLIRHLPRQRQTLFFSATIDETIKKLAYSLVHNPIRIQISPDNPVNKNIDHAIAFMEMDDKRFFLERLINEQPESKLLVFVRTKVRAERVLKALERVGLRSQTIHGDKDQQDRLQVMREFRDGVVKVLIATDVSARGIDIPNVDYVVNYDLPEQPENYVHRIGRTGRGTNKGRAVSFCSPEENPLLADIEAYIGGPIDRVIFSDHERQLTRDISPEASFNLKALLKEVAEFEENGRKKKKNKK